VTRPSRRERRREAARRRRRQRLRTAVPGLLLLVGTGLLLAGTALAATPAPTVAGGASGVPLASASTMAALAAGWQPTAPAVISAPALARIAETAAEAPAARTVSPPVTVEIARIDVRADLVELDLDADGRLEVPADPALAGWYVRGPRPGDPGPAVIAGHVDSPRGPAVFHRLGELAPGDEVVVHRADGSSAGFVVQRLERWPKRAFPTDDVYRDAAGAELRLITCGGVFDPRARRYEDNVIVFATAADPRPRPSSEAERTPAGTGSAPRP
jgi:hypothetical protein